MILYHHKIRLVLVFLFCVFISNTSFAASCKNYTNCKQAVIAWCAGKHDRADGDKDGIPCENVCTSLQMVKEIKQDIGCKK